MAATGSGRCSLWRESGDAPPAAGAAGVRKHPRSLARDGVPATSFPRQPGRAALGDLRGRDFAVGRPWGTTLTANEPGPEPAAPRIAVLATARDRPVDWLNAGQALHRITLLAATRWVFASMHTQALELDPFRAAVRRDLRLGGHPQMLLRLGHAGASVTTPRRPLTEVFSDLASVPRSAADRWRHENQ